MKKTFWTGGIVTALILVILAGVLIKNAKPDMNPQTKAKAASVRIPDDPQGRATFETRRLINPKTGRIPDRMREKELAFARTLPTVNTLERAAKQSGMNAYTWNSRGPWNLGGRTRALGVDVRNSSILLAGGVSGGMWRTTNGGSTWAKTTQSLQLHSVSCLAQDTRSGKQDTWYYGTGEWRGNSASGEGGYASYSGNGLFKSTNNGQSWTLLSSTATDDPETSWLNDYVWNVCTDPSNAAQDEVYYVFAGVVCRSTSGGSSFDWVLGYPSTYFSTYCDVAITSTGVVYATMSSYDNTGKYNSDSKGIWRSTDGITWTNITPAGFPSQYRRFVIGIAPSNENVVYFLGETPGTGALEHGFWKYTYVSGDGSGAGGTWEDRSANLPALGGDVGDFDSQSSYDLICKVKPDNPSVVFFGATNLYRTTDGLATGGIYPANPGANNAWIGGYSVANNVSITENHFVDQHAIAFKPGDPNTLYSGNDGGVFKTANDLAYPIAWETLNHGYLTTQFYTVAIDPATTGDPDIIGGMQDNGSYFVQSTSAVSAWTQNLSGDGCYCAISNGGLYWYSSWQYGGIYRDDWDASGSYQGFTRVDPTGASNYLFVAPFALDPNNSNRMYLVEDKGLWRNSDLTAIPRWSNSTTAVNWTKLTNSWRTNTVSAVGISTTPANRVYYGDENGGVFRLDNAHTGNPAPVTITGSNPAWPAAYVTCIAVDSHNGDNAIVVFSNYEVPSLWYTTNGGTSWTDVSGNLENDASYSGTNDGPSCRWADILYVSGHPVYFVGTSTGLYSTLSLNGSSTVWAQESPTSIGNVVVDMVKSRESDGLVVAATHGYGIFSSTISTGVQKIEDRPVSFALFQNYPNPFNPETAIRYRIPERSQVTLKVFDTLGRTVATLVDKEQGPGEYQASFMAGELASGVYLCRIQAGSYSAVTKMNLLK